MKAAASRPPGDFDGPAPRRRLHVLVSAFSCNPGSGSEPGAGWLWSVAAAARHEVTLLTWAGYRPGVDAALADHPQLAIQPIYLPQPSWLPGPADDLRVLRARYAAWQVSAHRVVKAAHRQSPFDVAHHLTLAADWMAPGVGGVAGLPLVWGPVGGYSRRAWRMARWLGPGWLPSEVARRAGTGVARAAAGRWAARHSALVVAQNEDAAQRLRRLGAPRVVVEPNVALDGDGDGLVTAGGAAASAPDGYRKAGRAIFAGRLIRWKGAALALRALADPRLAGWSLDVYGDGPDRGRLIALGRRLDLGTRVQFQGMRARHEVRAAFASSDVLLLPSLNDSAGWVIAEAARAGCPTVCLDRGGPPGLVGEGAGTVVPVGSGLPRRIADAVLASRRLDPPLRRWDTDRLPALVDGWYQSVAAAPDPATSA